MGRLGVEGQADGAVRTYLGLLTVDELADALFYVALGWVAARSGSPAQAAGIFVANTIPRVAVLLLGGVLGDRLGVARVAVWSLGARLLLMVGFAVLLLRGTTNVLALATLAALVGLADAVHMPAMRGVAGLLAGAGEQARVQTMLSVASNAAVVAGTAGGGLLLGLFPQSVGLVAAGLLGTAVVLVVVLRRRAGERLVVTTMGEVNSVRAMLSETLHTLGRDRVSRMALLLLSLSNMVATAPIFIGVPLKAQAYHWSPLAYSLAFLAISLGYIVGGAWAVRWWGNTSSGPALQRPVQLMVPAAAALVVLALARTPWLVGAACFFAGFFFAPTAAQLRGAIQERTPNAAMGRVNSTIQLAIYSLIPVGQVIFGALATASLSLAGLVMAAALLVMLAWAGRPGAGALTASTAE